MRLKAALLVLPLVALALPAVAADEPATFEEAKALAASTEKPLLIDFFATW
jgi:hypothetical protein